jgi:hypothetical protein
MKLLFSLTLFFALTIYSQVALSQTTKKSEPVTLVNFTTQLANNKVCLAWNAKQETALNYYSIERSYDNKEFNQVAIFFPYEDPSTATNYSYKDPFRRTTAPVIYYRLRMVDKDGKYKLSETTMVRTSKQ